MRKFFAYIINAVRTHHQIMNPAASEGNPERREDVLWTEDDLAFLERLASFDPDEIGKSTNEERAMS